MTITVGVERWPTLWHEPPAIGAWVDIFNEGRVRTFRVVAVDEEAMTMALSPPESWDDPSPTDDASEPSDEPQEPQNGG